MRKLLQLGANGLMGAGIPIFALALFVSIAMFMEGVTHRVGEGNILPAESPAQTRERLTTIGWLMAAAGLGWMLARLGDSLRASGRGLRRPRLAALAAELLLILGGACLGFGFLVWRGSRLAVDEVADDYRRLGIGGAIIGPFLLAAGLVLFRRVSRHPDTPS